MQLEGVFVRSSISTTRQALQGHLIVADQNNITDEAGAVVISTAAAPPATKEAARSFLDPAKRMLSEDELATPGVRRYLIEDMERLEARCAALLAIEIQFYDLRVKYAVLEGKQKTSAWHEILSGLCLAVGSAGIGVSIRLLSIDGAKEIGIAVMVVSAAMVIAGILSKVFK